MMFRVDAYTVVTDKEYWFPLLFAILPNFNTRIALYRQKDINEVFDRDPDEIPDKVRQRIYKEGENLLEYMLFINETCTWTAR